MKKADKKHFFGENSEKILLPLFYQQLTEFEEKDVVYKLVESDPHNGWLFATPFYKPISKIIKPIPNEEE